MQLIRTKHSCVLLTIVAVVLAWTILAPERSEAIPAFARKYGTSCTTCHLDFPKLNDFGKAFKDAGFKFPKDDESFVKVPPVMLGAPAQKQLWPHAVWPGVIDGLPPIGLRMNNFFQVVGRHRARFDALAAPGAVPQFIPSNDFETGLFSIFTAGNFGSDIAFWVDDDLSVAGNNADGGLGDGYLKFVNVSRFLHLPADSLSVRAGQFELDLPFSQARNINISPYDIYSEANTGAINSLANQQFVANGFTFADAAKGIEISGGHSYGGYHYSFTVADQNTTGIDQGSNVAAAPSATGSAGFDGLGFGSETNFKDLYARFAYRFNLEKDKASRQAVQAAGAMGPRDHTSLNLGTFYFYGRSLQRVVGADASTLTAREPFYRAGADFSFNYRTFNIYGLYMRGHDQNLMPVDATGTPLPLPLAGDVLPVGFVRGAPATFDGGFVQADYLALPWVMAILRYDWVNSTADRINGLALTPDTPFFAPLNSTRNRFTPGIQILIHSNIKASFEYQFRPQQSVTVGNVPATGLLIAQQPFRVNTATVGLEFVY